MMTAPTKLAGNTSYFRAYKSAIQPIAMIDMQIKLMMHGPFKHSIYFFFLCVWVFYAQANSTGREIKKDKSAAANDEGQECTCFSLAEEYHPSRKLFHRVFKKSFQELRIDTHPFHIQYS